MSQAERSDSGKATDCGVIAADNRAFLKAALCIMRTGAPCRDLPDAYERWHTGPMRFSRWSKKGIWEQVAETIFTDLEFEGVANDRTIVRAPQHAARATRGSKIKREAVHGVTSPRTSTRWSMRWAIQ